MANDIEARPDYKAPLIIPSRNLPTVKIASDETDSGVIIINASDFDPATMTEVVDDLPLIAGLPATLALITSVDAVRAMQARDERKTAAPLYAARLAALEG